VKKKDVKYYVFIGIILLIIILFELFKPKPIDWSFTLEKEDKIPYGTYVLFNTIKDIFPFKVIEETDRTVFESYDFEDKKKRNYLFISQTFNPDKYDSEYLVKLAQGGNNIFISAHFFDGKIADTLNLKTDISSFFDTSSVINFYNNTIKRSKDFIYGRSSSFYYFTSFDTVRAEVLAYSDSFNPIFLRYKYGEGYIYVNCVPEVYTNYAMIAEKNYSFAYTSLSYLPIQDVVWDDYYKPNRELKKRPLSFIFDNISFKYAYFLLLATALLFVIFTAKRRQRIIPVIKPFKNTSLDFVKTIGRLYYHTKNHKDIALKKYNYLQHYVQSKYYLNIADPDISFEQIAEKTGVDKDIIKKIMLLLEKIKSLQQITNQQLILFNNYIEDFYETSK
jgi:hypothetical protein